MGDFLKIKCDCGQEQFLQTGIGYLPMNGSEYRLYHCENCNRLEVYRHYSEKTNPEYRRTYTCENCSHIMTQVKDFNQIVEKQILVSCPNCNKNDIVKADGSNVGMGCWD